MFFFSFFFSFKSWAVVRFASYSTPTSLLRYGGTSEMQGTSLCEDRSFLPFWSFRSEHSRLSRQGSLLFSNNFREACKITQENMGQWRGGGKKATHPERKVFQGYHCLSWCLKSTLSLRFGASSFPRGRDFLNEIPI